MKSTIEDGKMALQSGFGGILYARRSPGHSSHRFSACVKAASWELNIAACFKVDERKYRELLYIYIYTFSSLCHYGAMVS